MSPFHVKHLVLALGLVAAASPALADDAASAASTTATTTAPTAPATSEGPGGAAIDYAYHDEELRRAQPNDRVLKNMELGTAALQAGDRDTAKAAFENALQVIEGFYADSESAKQARSVWTPEAAKDFKGEPYERAMAYYYRGLIALQEDDYETARASFKGGVLQDSLAEAEQFQADFALLDFLQGWASQCNGDAELASGAFDTVATRHPSWSRPGADESVLVVVESGSGPEKFATGEHSEELRFRPGQGRQEELTSVQIGEVSETPELQESVYFQASTRGGREIDAVLEGKARLKEGTKTTGAVLGTVGLAGILAANQQMAQARQMAFSNPALSSSMSQAGAYAGAASAGIMLIGLVANAVADAMNPEADVRYWASLPHAVQVLTLDPEDVGDQPIRAYFKDSEGSVDWVQTDLASAPGSRCKVVWLRSNSGQAYALGRFVTGKS